MPARNQFDQSQRQLFLSLKNELALIEKGTPKAVRAYERAFLRALPTRPRTATKASLRKAVLSSCIVLVGDFHPFRQSQKGFIRFMEDSSADGPARAVALECIAQRYQSLLDSYGAGHITAEELREEIDFDRAWPFPWPNYKDVLEYAREKGHRLLALNIDEKSGEPRALAKRDAAAAQILSEELARRPHQQIFVLIGELHLAPAHLPSQLAEIGLKELTLVVHQNEPTLYWRAPRSRDGHRAEVLRLRQREYCILNSVPWMRLRSYIDWLEGGGESDEEGLDLIGAIHDLTRLLAEALAVAEGPGEEATPVGPEELAAFSSEGLSKEEKVLFRHARDFQRTAYLPLRGVLLLPHVSTNALSEAASLCLWRKSARKAPKAAAARGDRLVLQFLVGYLGSKILNPKRKCNEVLDMEAFLRSNPGSSSFKRKKQAIFRRAISILAGRLEKISVKQHRPLKGPMEVEACRLAGYVLGNRLFLSMIRKPSALKRARQIFRSPQASEIWASHQLQAVSRLIGGITPRRKSSMF